MKIRERVSSSPSVNKHLIKIYKTGLDQSNMEKGSWEAASVIPAGLYTYFLHYSIYPRSNKEHQLRHGNSSSI